MIFFISTFSGNEDVTAKCLYSLNICATQFGKVIEVIVGTNREPECTDEYPSLKIKYSITPFGGWVDDMESHLLFLKINGIDSVIFVLDDFIFSSIQFDVLEQSLLAFKKNRFNYLVFRRPEYGLLGRFRIQPGDEFIAIEKNYLFYSALQVSVWNVDYFRSKLKFCSDIWEFETLRGDRHFFALQSPVIYRHVVEKGRWIQGEHQYALQYGGGGSGNRKFVRVSFFYVYFSKIYRFVFGFKRFK